MIFFIVFQKFIDIKYKQKSGMYPDELFLFLTAVTLFSTQSFCSAPCLLGGETSLNMDLTINPEAFSQKSRPE